MYATDDVQRSIVERLCTNLSKLRKAHGLTQGQLGEAAGITRNHYQLLESGRTATGQVANPRLSTLVALGAVLSVEAHVLLRPASPHAVWFWVAPTDVLSSGQIQALFDELIAASEEYVGDDAGAYVGYEDGTLTVGIGVCAPDLATAETIAEHAVATALRVVGVSDEISGQREIATGLADLVRLSDV